MPHLIDVKDVSTDDVRIELELKAGADDNLVMAYLFKNTSLQTTFAVNMTCLVPTENAEVGRPERLDLKQMLWHFLHFRLEVVTSRLEHELEQLKKRIHILEGFEKVFDALDEIIKIIRKSDGKADSAEKIMKRFSLDADQTDAILELKLYRLARLEILVIQQELAEKRKRARQIATLLKDEEGRWKLVREELEEIQNKYGNPKIDPRRSRIEEAEEVEYTAESFIVEEDNVVIVSRDGWVKRQKEVKDLSTTRLREGDSVLAAVAGSTRATMVFFSNFGVAYTSRIVDVPASTGYGDPVQKLFKLKDGEKIVAAFSLDPRIAKKIEAKKEGDVPPVHAIAVTSDGYAHALLAAGFRRGQHAVRPALCANRRGRRGRQRRHHDRRGNRDCGHVERASDAVEGRGGQFPFGSWPRRHPDQDRFPRRQGDRRDRVVRRSRFADRRNHARQRADDQHDEVRSHRPRRQGQGADAARRLHARRAERSAGAGDRGYLVVRVTVCRRPAVLP